MLKGTITVIVSAILIFATVVLINLTTGSHIPVLWLALGATLFGIAYGLQAGILGIYALSDFKGWLELVVDATWSLPNTLFGFIIGNIFYPFFADLSKSQSSNSGWIVYMPAPGSSGFGSSVLQTLGTINIGGAGQHERMHLFQSRLFGPLYLLLFALNYIINFLIQVIWTFTIGGLLWLLKQRSKAYFRPSSHSAVQGFFGWIYYATLFELWAYGSGNP
jgi:hypothetical protein